jgi:hypothetical protein
LCTSFYRDKKVVGVFVRFGAQLKPHHSHSAEPRAFPELQGGSALNVHWYFNKTAWMLSTVFQDWLRKVCLHSTS